MFYFATSSSQVFFSDNHMPLACAQDLHINRIRPKPWQEVQLPNACFYTEYWHPKNYPDWCISQTHTFYSFPHLKKNVLYDWQGEHEWT